MLWVSAKHSTSLTCLFFFVSDQVVLVLPPSSPPAFKGSKIKRLTRRAGLLPGLPEDERAPLPPCQAAPRCFPAVPVTAAAQLSAPKAGDVAAGAGKRGCSPYPSRFAKGSAATWSQVAAPSHLSMQDRRADMLHVISASQNSRLLLSFWGPSGCSSPHSAAGSGVLLLVHFQSSWESRENATCTLELPSFPTAPCLFAFCSVGWQSGKERGAPPGFPLPKPLSPQYIVPSTPVQPAMDMGMPAEMLTQAPKWWPQ